MSPSLPAPDLTGRPHGLVVERRMAASPTALYQAWTEDFDTWFAEPGMIAMTAEVGVPFTFVTRHEEVLQPHYGRFLRLVPDSLVELTWVTGKDGTAGAETVVTVRLDPVPDGTSLRLSHAGFYDDAGVRRHESAWADHVLPHLDDVLSQHGPRR